MCQIKWRTTPTDCRRRHEIKTLFAVLQCRLWQSDVVWCCEAGMTNSSCVRKDQFRKWSICEVDLSWSVGIFFLSAVKITLFYEDNLTAKNRNRKKRRLTSVSWCEALINKLLTPRISSPKAIYYPIKKFWVIADRKKIPAEHDCGYQKHLTGLTIAHNAPAFMLLGK